MHLDILAPVALGEVGDGRDGRRLGRHRRLRGAWWASFEVAVDVDAHAVVVHSRGRMPAVGATVVRGLVAPRATDEATEQDVDATRAGAN